MKKKLIILLALLVVTFLFANEVEMVQSVNEFDPNNTGHFTGTFSDEMWDLQFSYDVDTPSGLVGISGCETDGTYLYGTKWNGSGEIVKFDLQGNYIETFTIPGVVNLRDMAYDGQYFYGSDASNYIWEMDFNTQTLISTITTPGSVRSIAYDCDLDGFWYNNFSTDLHFVDRNGTLLNTITAPPSLYGCAYDNFSTGGPYLWIFTGTSTGGGCQVEQYDLNTLTLTGVTHSVDGDLGVGAYIAGGLFLEPNLVPGKITLGGLAQGTPDLIYGYEIGDAADPDAPDVPTDVAVIPDAGGALEALITWVCPSVTVAGDPLTDLTEMKVYRGDDLIYTDTNPSIGGPGTYNDIAVPASATYDYTVVGVNTVGEGLPVTVSTWIGEDVPAAVDNLTAVQTTPNTLDVTVSWDNPTTGLNGGPFNNPILGYHITQYPEVIVHEVTGMTTFWNTTVAGSGTYYWEVIPYNVTGDGGVAVTDPLFLAGPGLYVEDFEASNGGYATGGTLDCWEWGVPNYAEGPATAHSGTNCWGTNLTGTFPNSSQCYLQTIPIDLPAGAAFFSFYHWYDFGPSNWDGGNLKISTDSGTSWTLIYPDGGYPDDLASSNPLYPEPGYCGEPGLGWVEATFDLSTYAEETVLIKFDFGSTSVVEHPGWYIDDVMYEVPGGDPGTIEGNVTLNGGTGNVVDVEVTAGGVTVNPDNTGNYIISISAGTYDVTASLTGYEPETIEDVVVTENNATTGIDFTLDSIATLDPPENLAVDETTGIFTWDPPGGSTGWLDDMEAYNAGEYLALQSDDWTTWSGTPGGSDDGYVVNDNAYSGSNSVKVEGTSTDLVHEFGAFTSGVYEASMMMFVESGYGGYYNLLHFFNGSSSEWGLEAYFGSDGTGYIHAGGSNAATFNYPTATWFEVKCMIDLDSDWAEYYVNNTFVHEWQWSVDSSGNPGSCEFGATDIYASAPTGDNVMFYFDDVVLDIITPARELQSYNVYLDGTLQGNTTDTEWPFTGLVNGTAYTAGVEAVYDEGISDLVTIDFVANIVDAGNIIIAKTELSGNYPNPFNPTTAINFSLANAGHVNIDIYNIKGEKVKTLVDSDLPADNHTVLWNGDDNVGKKVASGVYFYKMKAGKFVESKKMILMK